MKDTLPALPEPLWLAFDRDNEVEVYGYTADQMHAFARAAVEQASVTPCLWIPDHGDSGAWDTECGHRHLFVDGDSADNLYLHCPYCGGRLIEPNLDAPADEGERDAQR